MFIIISGRQKYVEMKLPVYKHEDIMREIVLASASPRRSELLKQIGLKFEIVPSDVDENIDSNLIPEEVVMGLSCRKALDVAKKIDNRVLVIGADTIVVKDRILGKPVNDQDAFNMLKSLQGDWHNVITGVCVIDTDGFKIVKGFERTRVKMRNLQDREIYSYIATGEPADKAGAYGIQGMGALLVEKIEGCYFNVVGLPLSKLAEMLEDFGLHLLG